MLILTINIKGDDASDDELIDRYRLWFKKGFSF